MYCSGTRIIPLRFGSKSYDWKFHLALVSASILGADFLWHNHLLVDIAGGRVLESSTLNSVRESFLSSEDPGFLRAALLSTPECIPELLSDFPDDLSSDGFTASPPWHGVCHHLLTQPGPPVFPKARRLNPDKLETAKKEFESMEKAGIIRRSISPALSTRSRRRTVRGDPVVIIVVSTTLLFQIDINFPTLPTSLLESQVQRFFPSSTFRKDIIRFQWLRMTSRRLQSLLRLRYLSSCDFLLGLETLDRPFIGLWIRF